MAFGGSFGFDMVLVVDAGVNRASLARIGRIKRDVGVGVRMW